MFEVDEEVANQSHTVKNMIEGACCAWRGVVPPKINVLAACASVQAAGSPRVQCMPRFSSASSALLHPSPAHARTAKCTLSAQTHKQNTNTHADTGTDEMIPLPNVPGKILSKVIEYCKFHVEAAKQV